MLEPGDRVEITLFGKHNVNGIVLKNGSTTGSSYCYVTIEVCPELDRHATTQYIQSDMMRFVSKMSKEELLTHELQMVRDVALENNKEIQ